MYDSSHVEHVSRSSIRCYRKTKSSFFTAFEVFTKISSSMKTVSSFHRSSSQVFSRIYFISFLLVYHFINLSLTYLQIYSLFIKNFKPFIRRIIPGNIQKITFHCVFVPLLIKYNKIPPKYETRLKVTHVEQKLHKFCI